MSISQNFPAEGPTLNLNFAGSKKLDPRITFTRTSTATYMDDNGLITIASTNTPRFEHSVVGVGSTVTGVESLGLLIEESRTNLITYSEQFNNAAWTKSNAGITTNTSATTAPDGSTNAEILIENTSLNSFHYINGGTLSKSASSIQYTVSFWVKDNGRQVEMVIQSNSSNGVVCRFNPATGQMVVSPVAFGTGWTAGSSNVVTYPNGWYRVSMTATSDTLTTLIFQLATHNGTTNVYTGDGTSGFYLWGAQLEAGAFPTSYIPTVASTVTRSADNASMTGTNFSSWYNSSEGTLFVNQSIPSTNLIASPATTSEVSIDDGTSNNFYSIRYVTNASTPYIDGYCRTSSSDVMDTIGSEGTTFPNPVKAALALKLNDSAFCYNGNSVQTDTSITISTLVNRLSISSLTSNPKAKTIAQLLYYPTRLTNSQLQNLTK